jgi:type VI secretion system secreted protein VgrG
MPDDQKALLSLKSPAPIDLIPVRLVAHEQISELFYFEIDAVASDKIDASSMLNKPACLSINHGGKETRYFHGIVGEFGPRERGGALGTVHRLVLVPQLAQTNMRIDCRLFFNKTAEDILTTIFDEAGVTERKFRLYSAPKPRKVTTQYNETSLHFVTRLMEEEGWFYFFEHTAESHTLVITNGNNGFTTIPGASLVIGSDNTLADMLTDFRGPEPLTHGKIGLKDYDPDAPNKDLKVEQKTVLKHAGTESRAVFHWPALTRDTAEAKDRAKWRMEAAEAAASLVSAEGAMASLVAGGKFKLKDDDNRETQYVVRQITHFAEDQARRSDAGYIGYSNNFTAFANTVPWRQPMTAARPRMEGLHTAIVLAPQGEDIYTDEQGRIKIRFFWDWRKDAKADNSDWVRVAQPWAGNQWGGQFIPRAGTEVAVAFMDGDPDRPVVVGGLYNAIDKPIYPKDQKTKLGFRSRSANGGGIADFNEFTFDDEKGSELVFLHAQKDMKTEVENNQSLYVMADRTVKIDGQETVTVKNDQSIEIKMGNLTTNVDMGNLTTDVKMGNVSIKADLGTITVEAMQSITLKVGQSSITIDQTGITLSGMMITINGQVQTQISGAMTQVTGSAMLQLSGGITMIG